MSNILNIGKSALAAAQVGLATTGHNIANANTPGYSRQVVVQAAAQSQNFGFGFVGQGAEIAGVTRVFNNILAAQMVRSQASSSAMATYSRELGTINNMLSDPTAGLNPAMSAFFGGLQDLSANPSDTATRQSTLSTTQSLVSRFQSTSDRLNQLQEGVNTQITTSVGLVNTYARQIANLNDVIEKAVSADGNTPNDLLDQRDQLVLELSKQIKTTVIPQGQGSYNIFVGNGLPLVVGKETFQLVPASSPTDPSRTEVAYQTQGKVTVLGPSSLTGGALGGLIQFRAESLDPIQNQIGQLAVTIAETFNAQHRAGFDINGNLGGALFSIPDPAVSANANNTGNAVITSKIQNAAAITASDYRLEFDGANYNITRLSDVTTQTFASLPQTIDGINFTLASGTIQAGDNYVIRPTQQAAGRIQLSITDPNKLAVGGPAITASTSSTTASISAPTATSTYASSPLATPLSFTFNPPGFVAGAPVTVTLNGVTTEYNPGDQVTIDNGAVITTQGIRFSITGTPAAGDTFTITPGTFNGPGDNRNGLLLASLQNAKTVSGNKSFSETFGLIVNNVGNKTRELDILNTAEAQVLEQTTAAVQAESGVNLDEEATNLIRYQQSYQAAGKLMQIASQLFDVLLQLGN